MVDNEKRSRIVGDGPSVFFDKLGRRPCIKELYEVGVRAGHDEVEAQRFEEDFFGEQNSVLIFFYFLCVSSARRHGGSMTHAHLVVIRYIFRVLLGQLCEIHLCYIPQLSTALLSLRCEEDTRCCDILG